MEIYNNILEIIYENKDNKEFLEKFYNAIKDR